MTEPSQLRYGMPILGNQLFPLDCLQAALKDSLPADARPPRILMIEDEGFCHTYRHHKQRLVMVLAAMRSYRDQLQEAGFCVDYRPLADRGPEAPPPSFAAWVRDWATDHKLAELVCWEIPGRKLESQVQQLAADIELPLTWLPSPMFLNPREQLESYFAEHPPAMAGFYRAQRKRLQVLLDSHGQPTGGKWSYDDQNRAALPAQVTPPGVAPTSPTPHQQAVCQLVAKRFPDNPGELPDTACFWPSTRAQALDTLSNFVETRFAEFGPYEDALSTRDPFLFHSTLSAPLNLGLLTPREVLTRVLDHASARPDIPLNSVEGFVRQLIGWREFVFGVYRHYGETQARSNFFDHRRTLTAAWYDGTTGLPPLDDAIQKAQRLGWAHHIERLMVLGNLMLLCEIDPRHAHRWFMEMFVDASAWVMGPNVWGMALFADGGTFTTKPYICASNYILKMSDYPRPRRGEQPNWIDVMDGLYWRFIDRHQRFFAEQARLGYAVRTLSRLSDQRKTRIFAAAEDFLERFTGS